MLGSYNTDCIACYVFHMCNNISESDGDKDSSSDWSSSDEDDDNTVNPLRPSSHSSLKAQWEWRAMGEGDSEK